MATSVSVLRVQEVFGGAGIVNPRVGIQVVGRK